MAKPRYTWKSSVGAYPNRTEYLELQFGPIRAHVHGQVGALLVTCGAAGVVCRKLANRDWGSAEREARAVIVARLAEIVYQATLVTAEATKGVARG